ncbi:DUF3027 domain-containing protein [Propioniferax innocua]|uniref:DUF3027 family protein n=1 Tax=Propioniferax innocua TaxID=1753 RepID=A0A542ZCB1_9ACTN|nr:DUF3027 domain-containing protein [Propioniferax innocua]TQL57929.1 DUF3027 family protein [Propioniferax innocua]
MAAAPTRTPRRPKLDPACAEAIDFARDAVAEVAIVDVGEHLGMTAEADRVVTHRFACDHPGYPGWYWAVTVVRASRAKKVTINEVVLLPGEGALLSPEWVPWEERVEPGDLQPGMVEPTPDNDPRLEPGYTAGEHAADADPAEASWTRAIVAELGLGRERVLSIEGRSEAAERWISGDGGPRNEMTKQAPADCLSCAYFVRLTGALGHTFGVCANGHAPSDGRVVSVDHGCGAHSDVVADHREAARPAPVWDTIDEDQNLFD